MFTGIIECTGAITDIYIKGSNKTFWVSSPISAELRADQSLSHDGVCLTVEEINGDRHKITAVAETLSKTNLDNWAVGHTVNLERCLALNGRLDGHLVQGHVDSTGAVKNIAEQNGSWLFTISYPKEFAELIIEKGSITVNGTSLTAFNITNKTFDVAIIP